MSRWTPLWWSLLGMAMGAASFAAGAALVVSADAAPPVDEIKLAEAYHCGVLDALQEKRGRGRACDSYKEIARRRGVQVPP